MSSVTALQILAHWEVRAEIDGKSDFGIISRRSDLPLPLTPCDGHMKPVSVILLSIALFCSNHDVKMHLGE